MGEVPRPQQAAQGLPQGRAIHIHGTDRYLAYDYRVYTYIYVDQTPVVYEPGLVSLVYMFTERFWKDNSAKRAVLGSLYTERVYPLGEL